MPSATILIRYWAAFDIIERPTLAPSLSASSCVSPFVRLAVERGEIITDTSFEKRIVVARLLTLIADDDRRALN